MVKEAFWFHFHGVINYPSELKSDRASQSAKTGVICLLEEIRDYFACGGIRFDSHDQTYKYEVRSLDDLTKKILPHFEKYHLRTTKINDFESLRKICRAMKVNLHLSADGIKEIIDSAYTMNNIGARHYLKADLLSIIGKMKV